MDTRSKATSAGLKVGLETSPNPNFIKINELPQIAASKTRIKYWEDLFLRLKFTQEFAKFGQRCH